MTHKLSICIPTLNRGNYIGITLESITCQMEETIEIVIVDGGSTDNTQQVVNSYQCSFQNIRYIRNEASGKQPSNEGFDRDCNSAVELADGEYCWLMTDDDILMPGAIRKILSETEKGYQLIVASIEVRDKTLTELLLPRRPDILHDRIYKPHEWNHFAVKIVFHLTFVGAVIINRKLWLSRSREKYFGSGFIHIGVIFCEPIKQDILIIADPQVSLRYGNGQWMNRAFQIWMLDWPNLIWSLPELSDKSKKNICSLEPWKEIRNLLYFRALGLYTLVEFHKLWSNDTLSLARIVAYMISILPKSWANFLVIIYQSLFKKSPLVALQDLRYNQNCSTIARLWLRLLGF